MPARGAADAPRIVATAASICVLSGLMTASPFARALDVVRSGARLADRPTVFEPARGAPETAWRKAGATGALSVGGPASGWSPATQPDTVFRPVEVAPARIEITRELLGSLKARRTESQAIAIDLPADVLFDFDRAELRADAAPTLARAAELLASYPDARIAVRGHSDGKGTAAYNDALSLRRARTVAERLNARPARRIEVEGRGSREPIAPEQDASGADDAQGRQRNRRVEIVIDPGRPVS
ncbi:MAG: OmpA family protein [Comamonadaceae bacterium]|nr:MAG: OmpA family protein [Comamonadaceae bacterium]